MDEQQRRIRAISLYLQGKPPGAICKALGRSRPWFYKWLKAYDPSRRQWAQSRSRAPKRFPTRTGPRITELVCSIRQRLVKAKYSQKGAVAIQWELQRLGVRPLPAIWTINRILKRQGLLVKPTYQRRATAYPALQPTEPNVAHQMDWVGPRYLKSKERFYGVHLIDAFSNAVALGAAPSKRDSDIVRAVVAAGNDWEFPLSFRSITNSRFEALTVIHAASDCSSDSAFISASRSSLFLQASLGATALWKSSMMSATNCSSVASSSKV